MKKLSNKSFWETQWIKEQRSVFNFPFDTVIRQRIPKRGTYFEVGCAPGAIMCYFHKVLEYEVNGIDYIDRTLIENYLDRHDVKDYRIYSEDFTTARIEETFDVVASFGFVEHFSDYRQIIQMHAELVKDQGYLIIEVPNLRFVNGLIYRIFNPRLLAIHNTEAMKPGNLRNAVKDEFDIIFLNYVKTSMFSFNEDNPELSRYPLLKRWFVRVKKGMERLKLDNLPNRWFSPYLIMIARKKQS